MNLNKAGLTLLLFISFLIIQSSALAQTTTVKGTVTDSTYNQPLPFVTIYVPGTKIATQANAYGKFKISSKTPFNQIKTSFLGYKERTYNVEPGQEQEIKIKILSVSKQLAEVVVGSDKLKRYSNKNNPAVELIRKVIENKEKNRPESYNYVEYKEYDKVQFSLANLKNHLSDKKFLQQYKFLLDNRDTTTAPGKSLLPIFLDEKLSQYYYRKNPEKEKTITLAQKTANLGADVDNEGVTANFKYIFYKVDIYSNSILLITSNFLSPIANSAPTFYKYFIADTVTENNVKLVELDFIPRSTADVLFEGRLFVTLDGNYAVARAELTINKNINLNFVRSLSVNLDFEQNPDGRYHLSKSRTLADFGLNSRALNLFGVRSITYKNYLINQPRPDTTYDKPELLVPDEVKHKSEEFWAQNRLDTLNTAEAKTYKNLDSLNNMRSFKTVKDIFTFLVGGYKNLGPVEIGPIGTFYSFNPVEGFRLQLGGRTTPEFSTRFYFETYGAYGFNDDRFKYFLRASYSLNNKSVYKFPRDYIRASIQNDISTPGQGLQSDGGGNVLLSFKRGNTPVYLYDRSYKVDYLHELENHFSYHFSVNNLNQSPAGALYFTNTGADGQPQNINNLITTEFNAGIRYAPHEEFYQGKVYRYVLPSKYPIFTLNYYEGFKSVLNGQYDYQRLTASIDKHFYVSQLGYIDLNLEASRLFGQVPYPLLNILPANQTYFYNTTTYNLMNYLEFVTDHYESVNFDWHLNGFFLNKIPLFKKLKWREVASFKAVYGGVSNENNPSIHPSLYQFPVNSSGQPITYALGDTPYAEGSIGIENIFKVLRLTWVRRFTYLDHPDIAKSGLRVSAAVTF